MSKATWHPSSGEWGILGSTTGYKNAQKAKSLIAGQVENVRGREEGIKQFYSELGGLTDTERELLGKDKELFRDKTKFTRETGEAEYLTDMEKFLESSYTIGKEADYKATKQDFAATTPDAEADFKKKQRRGAMKTAADVQTRKERALDFDVEAKEMDFARASLGLDRQDIKTGMEEMKALQNIEDILYTLESEKRSYG